MTDQDLDNGLVTRIDTPLPSRLACERASAIVVAGACATSDGPVVALEVVVDGHPTPAIAHSMPRPDLAASAGPGALRSGFWATVGIPASTRPRTVAVELAVTLADGSKRRRRLGAIALVPATPAHGALTNGRGSGPATPGIAPQIAICMATYDPPTELLERQLASIRNQTHERWICLISDDASSPAKLAALERLIAGDPRFLLSRSSRRQGFFLNFERALRLAPAEVEFVALADQDDRWHPEKLDALVAATGSATLAYCDARIVGAGGELHSPTYWNRRRNNSSNFASLLLANTVSGSAALFRRQVVDRALPFPRSAGGLFHDHWLALVGLALGEIAYVDRPLYDYVQHTGALLGHEGAQAWAGAGGARRAWARLRHFRDDPQYFYEHWRTTYFREYLRVALMARVLLERCGDELSAPRRAILRGLLDAERSPATLAWLAARQLRGHAGRDETVGAEGRLLRAVAWRRLLAAQPASGAAARRRLPLDGGFPADRLDPTSPLQHAPAAAATAPAAASPSH